MKKVDNGMKRYYRTLRPILLQILEEAAEEDAYRVRQGLTLEERILREERQRTILSDIVDEYLDPAFGYKSQEDQNQ